MPAILEGAAPLAGKRSRLGALIELGKFRLSALAVFAVLAGIYLGSPTQPGLGLVGATVAGALLVAMGGCALNMWLEREADGRMQRTAARPLPSGRLTPVMAATAGLGSVATGLLILALATSWLTTVLCASIFVTYVGIYTPLKRLTSLNTLIGAIPGALPPVVGYTAGGGALDGRALALFLILYCWQIPHFLAIAWRYREDYARAGMKMLPVVDPSGRSTAWQMLLFSVALVGVSILPYAYELAGMPYLLTASALGTGYGAIATIAGFKRTDGWMRRAFHASLVYLPVLLGVMCLDRVS